MSGMMILAASSWWLAKVTLSNCGCKGSVSVNVALRTCSRKEASLLLPPSEYLALSVSQFSFAVRQG